MPPRSAKKASGGSAGLRKTASRTAKGTPKAQIQPEVAEEPPKVEVVTAPVDDVKKEIKVEEVVVEKAVADKPVMLDSGEKGLEHWDVKLIKSPYFVNRPFALFSFRYQCEFGKSYLFIFLMGKLHVQYDLEFRLVLVVVSYLLLNFIEKTCSVSHLECCHGFLILA